MGRSSSCRDGLHEKSPSAREFIPYLVLLRQGSSTLGLILHSTRNTHFIDELILLLGVLKLIFRNGRFHVDKSKQSSRKERDATRTSVGVCPFLTLNLHSRSINLWQWQQTGLSIAASRMIPTLQSTFPGQTEGLLGP